jgi:hypothetical protein
MYLVCSIDWTALGTCLQAVFVGVAAGLGIWQFIALNKNLRTRNTLNLLADFNAVRHVLRPTGTEITLAGAVPLVHDAKTHLAAFKTGHEDFMAERKTQAAGEYLTRSDGLTAFVNYFQNAARLAKRNLIDTSLFFDAQGYIMATNIEPVQTLLAAESREYALSGLEPFFKEARKYLEQHPVVEPTQAG